MKVINIAAYKFVKLEKLPELRSLLLAKALACSLKGTILLSTEGINLMLAGELENINSYKQFLSNISYFNNLIFKHTESQSYPFKKLVVRIKKEIITMRCPDICPEEETAPHLSPEVLNDWYHENKDMLVLDVRNDFEVAIGTFQNAVDLNIKSFSDFPEAVDKLPESIKDKPIVTFCTGGIRCEKASALMMKKGFKKVYQLDGGILNYFDKCGEGYFTGKCFVFDDRISIEAQ